MSDYFWPKVSIRQFHCFKAEMASRFFINVELFLSLHLLPLSKLPKEENLTHLYCPMVPHIFCLTAPWAQNQSNRR